MQCEDSRSNEEEEDVQGKITSIAQQRKKKRKKKQKNWQEAINCQQKTRTEEQESSQIEDKSSSETADIGSHTSLNENIYIEEKERSKTPPEVKPKPKKQQNFEETEVRVDSDEDVYSTDGEFDDDSDDGSVDTETPGGQFVCKVYALHPWNSEVEGDLIFNRGDIISVISKHKGEWWKGELRGKEGLFPGNYVLWPGPQAGGSSSQVENVKNESYTTLEDRYKWDATYAYLIAFHVVLRRKIASCTMHNPKSSNFFLNASYCSAPNATFPVNNFAPLTSQEVLNSIGNINFRNSEAFVSYTVNEIKSNLKGHFSETYRDLLLEIKDLSDEERRRQLIKSAFKGLSNQKTVSEMLQSWNEFTARAGRNIQKENDYQLEYEREIKNLMDWSREEKAISDTSLLENIAWVLKITSPYYAKAFNVFGEGEKDSRAKEFYPRVDAIVESFENEDSVSDGHNEKEKAEFSITNEDVSQQISRMAIDPDKWMSSEVLSAFGLTNDSDTFGILRNILRTSSAVTCRFKFKWIDIQPLSMESLQLKPWFVDGIIEAAYAAGRDPYFWKNTLQWETFFGKGASPKFECGVKSICVTDDFQICGTLHKDKNLYDVLFPMREKWESGKDENDAAKRRSTELEEKIPDNFMGLKYCSQCENVDASGERKETWCFENQHSVAILGVQTKSWTSIEEQKISVTNSTELSKEGCIVVYGSVLQSRDELAEGVLDQKLFSYTDLGDINANPGFGLCSSDAGLLLPQQSEDKRTPCFFTDAFPAYIEGAVSGGPLQCTYCRVYEHKSSNFIVSKVPSCLSKIWAVTPVTKGSSNKLKWEPVQEMVQEIDLNTLFGLADKIGLSRVLIIRAVVPQRDKVTLKSSKKDTKTAKKSPKDIFAMDLEAIPSLVGIFKSASDNELDILFELQDDATLYERYHQEPIVAKIVGIMTQDEDSDNEIDKVQGDDLLDNIDLSLAQSIFTNSAEIQKLYDFGLSEKKLLRKFQKEPDKFITIKNAFFGNTKIRKVVMDYMQAQERKKDCLLEKRATVLDEFCLLYRGQNKDKITLSYQDVFLLRTKERNVSDVIQDLMQRAQNKSESYSILGSILGFMLEQLKMGMTLDSIFMDEFFFKEPLRGTSSQTLLSSLLSAMSGFMQSKIISMYGLQDLPMPFCVPVSKNTTMFYWWVPLQAYFQHLMQSVPTVVSLGADIKCGKSMLLNELFQCNFGSSDDCIDHFGIQFLPNCPEFKRGFHLVDIHGPALHYTKLIKLCISTFGEEAWYFVHISAKKTLLELSEMLKTIEKLHINVTKQLVWLVRDVTLSTSTCSTQIEKLLIEKEILPAANTNLSLVEDHSVVEPFGVPKSRIFTITDVTDKGNVAQSMIRQLGIRMKHLIGDSESPIFPFSTKENVGVQPRSLAHYQRIQTRLSPMCDANMRIDLFADDVLDVGNTCRTALKHVLDKSGDDLHTAFLPFSMHEHKLKETKDKFRVQSTDNYEKRQEKKKKLEPELQKLQKEFKIKNVTPFISIFAELLSNVKNDFDSLNVFACAMPLTCKPYLKKPEEELTKLRQKADEVKNETEALKKNLMERGCTTIETSSPKGNDNMQDDGKNNIDVEDSTKTLKSKLTQLSSKLNDLRNSVCELDSKIQRSTISVEHCLREITFARDAGCLPKTLNEDDHVASLVKLLFQGWPLELLDGDHLDMKPELMKQVFAEAQRVYEANMMQGSYQRFLPTSEKPIQKSTNSKKCNPFFISVIGPQSSGKSTLLNFLFGGSFQVAGGRCTKGLSISVVPTDTETYANPLVILDTEGLMSIERDDPEFDRKMMLFTMASSHVVLINVKGQINTTMSNILGIAVFALDKFKFRKTRPKLIFVLRDMSLTNTAEHKDLFLGIRKELDIVCQEANVHLDDVIEFHGEKSCCLLPSAFKDDYAIVQDRDVTRNVVTKRPMSEMFIDRVKSLREEILQEAKKRSESDGPVEDLKQWIEKGAETWTRIQECSDLFDIDRVAELRLKSEISSVHEKLMKDFEEKWEGSGSQKGEFQKILQKYLEKSRMLKEYDNFIQEIQQTLDVETKRLLEEIEQRCSAEYYGTKLVDELSDRVRQQMRSFKLSAETKGRIVRDEHGIESRIQRCKREMDQWVGMKAIELKQHSQNNEEMVVAEFNDKFREKTLEVERFLLDNSATIDQMSSEVESGFRNILDSMSPVDKPCASKHLTHPEVHLIIFCQQFLEGDNNYQLNQIKTLEKEIIKQTQTPYSSSEMITEWNVGRHWDQSMPDWKNFVPSTTQKYLLHDYYVNLCLKLGIAQQTAKPKERSKKPRRKKEKKRDDQWRIVQWFSDKLFDVEEMEWDGKYNDLTESDPVTIEEMSHRLICIAVVILVAKVCKDLTSDVQQLSAVEYVTVKPIVLRVAQWVKQYGSGLKAGQGASLQINLKGQIFSFLHNMLVDRKRRLAEKGRKIHEARWRTYGEHQLIVLKRLLQEGFNDIDCAKRFAEAILLKITEREEARQTDDFMGAVKEGASVFADPSHLSKLCFETVMDINKLQNMSNRCNKSESDLLFGYAENYSEYSRTIFDVEWKLVIDDCTVKYTKQAHVKRNLILNHIRKKAEALFEICNALQDGFWGDANENVRFFLAKTRELFLEFVVSDCEEKAKSILEEMNNKLATYQGNFSSQHSNNHFHLLFSQSLSNDESELFSDVNKTDTEFMNPIIFLKSLLNTMDLQMSEVQGPSHDSGIDMLTGLKREKDLMWTKAIGCEECCPYCGAKCARGADHIGNHVTKHRIAGFKGCWEKNESNEKVFVTDICDEEANYNKQWILPDNYVKGVVNSEMRQRVQMYGTKSGALTIGLAWYNANDLDIHVTCPDGSTLSYQNRTNSTGGELDHDMNAGGVSSSTAPYENIFWKDNPPMGEYKIKVHLYNKKDSDWRSTYTVQVTNSPPGTRNAKKVERYDGTLNENKRWSDVHTYTPGCTFTEHCAEAAPNWSIGLSNLSKKEQKADKEAQTKVFKQIENRLKTHYNL